jgi:hypothetical protein
MCALFFEISHRPDGKIADVLAPTHACTTANASVNYSGYVPPRDLANFPSPRWEIHVCSAFCLQGGGVFVGFGIVTISSCTISGNTAISSLTATGVRRLMLKISHRPDGKITDVLASTLARTTAADTLVNNSLMYVPQRPVFSHRPDGKIADVLALTHACTTAHALVNYRGYVQLPQRT